MKTSIYRTIRGVFYVFLFSALLLSFPGRTQPPVITGIAPVTPPTNGFAIDGDLMANFSLLLTNTTAGDWIQNGSPGGGVFTTAGVAVDPLTTFRVTDLVGNADLNIFTQGSKFNMNPNDWNYTASSPPGKDDMNNVMIHFAFDPSTNDLWFMMAGDRSFVSGTSYIDFELFQKSVTASGGKFTSAGTDGGRTKGDLAITIAYSSGGDNPEVVVYRWDSVGVNNKGVTQFSYVIHTPATGTVFAASNITDTVYIPFGAFGSTTYPQFAFAEAAVNLSKVFSNISVCQATSTVLIKTKASTALTAELKDMITPIQVNISTIPSVTVKDTTICSGGSALLHAVPSGGETPYTYLWSTSATTQDITVSPTVSTKYSVTVYGANGCASPPDTALVTVNTITAGVIATSQTGCSPFDPAAFTSTTDASGSGTITYQWQSNTTGCTGTWADISGATSATYNAGSVTVITYFRRVATSTLNGVACSANSNCLTVTPNSVTAGTIAGDQTLCSPFDPVAFTSTTDGSGSGTITYKWQSNTTSCTGTWADISGATSSTYDAGVVSVITYFRRVTISTLNSVPCSANSNCLTVTPNAVTAGTISGDQTLCTPFNPDAFTSTTVGTGSGTITYKWQSNTTSCTGTWADISGATSSTYDAPAVSVTTYFRRVAISTLNSVACSANSNCLTVTPNDLDPGSISANQTICEGEDAAAFTSVAATGDGTITYQWQSSTDSINFTNITGATSATYDPGVLSGPTWFKRLATSTLNGVACQEASNVVKVTTQSCGGHIFPTQTTCCNFLVGTTELQSVCYTTKGHKVSNATPGVFFYYTTITAPSANFTVQVTQTKSCSGFNYFELLNLQMDLYTYTCDKVQTTVTSTTGTGIAQLAVTGATAGEKYVMAIKYDVKSIIGSTFTGQAPTCLYDFVSSIGGTYVPNSTGHLSVVPGCSDNTPLPGNCTLTKSASKMIPLPQESVLNIAPNPFLNTAEVSFTLANDEAKVVLEVVSLSGSNVATLYEGSANAGVPYKLTINLGDKLGGSVYILTLRTSHEVLTQRISLIR